MNIIGLLLMIFFVILLLFIILKSPFKYPYYIHKFDVSGKRKPQIEEYIDVFIIDTRLAEVIIDTRLAEVIKHQEIINEWKKESQESVNRGILKSYRQEQLNQSIQDKTAYQFLLIRYQTRYKQVNYIKIPYKVETVFAQYSFSYDDLMTRYEQLEEINFECTLQKYHSKNQRKLMTKELRKEIMKRDNYTCRNCGKYMPDEIGLHIDHIVPVSKGGKSVPSNLQVLCSKCNGKKSNK